MFEVRSLSPAYWYVCDAELAKREKTRGQVSKPYASKAELLQDWPQLREQPFTPLSNS